MAPLAHLFNNTIKLRIKMIHREINFSKYLFRGQSIQLSNGAADFFRLRRTTSVSIKLCITSRRSLFLGPILDPVCDFSHHAVRRRKRLALNSHTSKYSSRTSLLSTWFLVCISRDGFHSPQFFQRIVRPPSQPPRVSWAGEAPEHLEKSRNGRANPALRMIVVVRQTFSSVSCSLQRNRKATARQHR